jgi:hypothetical protein
MFDASSVPALNGSDEMLVEAFRPLARIWNAGLGNAAELAPIVDAFEAEALKRGMNLSVILRGC